MNKVEKKSILAQKRHWRVRRKVSGSAERPRLTLFLSNKNINVQCVDDTKGVTLVSLSTISKELKGEKLLPNMAGCTAIGAKAGAKIKAAGIEAVVFDKGARSYTGCVKAFADAVRQAGINF